MTECGMVTANTSFHLLRAWSGKVHVAFRSGPIKHMLHLKNLNSLRHLTISQRCSVCSGWDQRRLYFGVP